MGRDFSLLVATADNISGVWTTEVDNDFGTPPLFVELLNRDCMERAIQALVAEDGGRWLEVYGTLQTSARDESRTQRRTVSPSPDF
jgi:hypothetical protein